jgi:hypothetical protein
MEMVSKQAIRKCFSDWLDVFGVQIHEVSVIAFLYKNILAVVAAIVDMVIGVVEQRGWAGHGCSSNETLKVFLLDSRLDLQDSPARNGAGLREKPLGVYIYQVDNNNFTHHSNLSIPTRP